MSRFTDRSEIRRYQLAHLRYLLTETIRSNPFYGPRIREAGHDIRFAVSRGPLNLATFLMGSTELLTAIYTDPEAVHALLDCTTAFIVDWLQLQAISPCQIEHTVYPPVIWATETQRLWRHVPIGRLRY